MRVRQAVTSSETRGRPSIWGVTLTPPPSMATCDDDFGLLGDDAHATPETRPDPCPPPPQQQGFYLPQKPPLSSSCFADDAAASHFSPAARGEAQAPDRKKHHQAAKRRGGTEEESGDAGEYCSYFSNGGGQSSKKGRGGGGSGSGSASSAAGVDYRKDREEWSDEAVGSLLDAYTERFEQLKRGNLRGRDWEDVAAAVTKQQQQHKAGGGGWGKSVEQCKNKIDNLKKRYKVECQRIAGSSGGGTSSQWPWSKKLEFIVGNATSIVSPKPASTEDDRSSHQQQQNNKSCIPSSAALLSIGIGSRTTPFSNPRWKRALLKIGGSELVGAASENVDPKVIMLIAREVQVASRHGVQVAIVVGSRNIYCGDTWTTVTGIDRAATCPIGMMASVMNAVLLQASLEKIGVETRVQTSLRMQDVAEPYIRQRAMRHLEKGRVVIFGGFGASTGKPLFTTDTAAALRASEINADVVLKGAAGDSVYGCPPGSNSNAAFEHISYRELVARGFNAMDVTAITFREENNVPVVLCNMLEPGNISKALCGDHVGTLVDQSGRID